MTKTQLKSTLSPLLKARKDQDVSCAFQGRAFQIYQTERDGILAESNIRFLNRAAAYATSEEWEQVENIFLKPAMKAT